ncbi:MAG: tetratricopeptide repeat protein [Nitrospiria bacterium]
MRLTIICMIAGALSGGCVKSAPKPIDLGPDVSNQAARKATPETSPQAQPRESKPESIQQESTASEDLQTKTQDTEALLKTFEEGIRLLESGQTELAREHFEELRDRYPDVGVFHINLGIAYRRLELLDAASQAYRQAITLQERDPATHYNLAIVLREQGKFREAEAAYQRAIALSPNFQDAHYNLAILYDLYLDDPAKALVHYQFYSQSVEGENAEMQLWIASLQKRLAVSKETQ